MPLVQKSDNTLQEFDPAKLTRSLMRAGASEDIAKSVVQDIVVQMREGMTTHEIYSRAFSLLRSHRTRVAAHYSLKRAMLEFGPTGFPFEAYLAELFRALGYKTITDQYVQGRCVEHEVDVVMTKEDTGETTYVEAKFHNAIGYKTDLQVVLYVHARVEDIADGIRSRGGEKSAENVRGMLVTNTKFTDRVMQYAACRGLPLMSWDYPDRNNLHDIIEQTGLFPITALSSISHSAKESLLANKIVLCRDVISHQHSLKHAGVPEDRIPTVVAEAAGLCNA
ncbi:MAG TPA: restriction endonuclease [Candidatus Paceibacterota bacterium]